MRLRTRFWSKKADGRSNSPSPRPGVGVADDVGFRMLPTGEVRLLASTHRGSALHLVRAVRALSLSTRTRNRAFPGSAARSRRSRFEGNCSPYFAKTVPSGTRYEGRSEVRSRDGRVIMRQTPEPPGGSAAVNDAENVSGQPSARPDHSGRWVERFAGLGLVLFSLTIFYGMTLPGLHWPWYVAGSLGVAALCGVFVGMPLLVTGRLRQRLR